MHPKIPGKHADFQNNRVFYEHVPLAFAWPSAQRGLDTVPFRECKLRFVQGISPLIAQVTFLALGAHCRKGAGMAVRSKVGQTRSTTREKKRHRNCALRLMRFRSALNLKLSVQKDRNALSADLLVPPGSAA